MPKLLWVGDACCHTGFGTVSRNILGHLKDSWDVSVLGINYRGDPHDMPYRVYPARLEGDPYGVRRFPEVFRAVKPDIVVVNHDTWNVARFLTADIGVPVVGYMPIDGPHIPYDVVGLLNRLTCAIWYTKFGKQEAERCGYSGESAVVPHGIDLGMYYPVDRKEARKELGLIEDCILIGNINANRFRKRLDISADVFKRVFQAWPKELPPPALYLHCPARNDQDGWNLNELISCNGLSGHIIYPIGLNSFEGLPEEKMRLIYSSMDLQFSTTTGEGWGLTTMEGIACGAYQVVPDFAALGEWLPIVDRYQSRHQLCPAENALNYPGTYNQVGKEPNRKAMVDKILWLMNNRHILEAPSTVDFAGYDWGTVSKKFGEVLSNALGSFQQKQADTLQAV